MPFSPLRSMPATLVAFMMMCATPASSSTGPDLSPYPCTDDDPDRGGGLPHCECDAYHNGAFQCMSRMCSKPWEDMNVCYPTRVGHPGTVLEGRYFNNYCDDGQDMCSPWTPPASSFPAFAFVEGQLEDADDSNNMDEFVVAARGCAMPLGEDQEDVEIYSDAGGCAACDGIPFRGSTFYDVLCDDRDGPAPQSDDYVSNSYIRLSPSNTESVSQEERLCLCLWCPPEPPSGFDAGNYNYGNYDGFQDDEDEVLNAFCGRL